MADPRYAIDWAPPDIGPGASFIASILNQNRAHDRGDANLAFQREAHRENMERASNEEARRADAEEYRRSVEAWNAMPMLQRAATRSVGMANANPYGVRFEEEQAPAPSLRDSGVNVMGVKDQYGVHAAQALLGMRPVAEAQDEIPQPYMPHRGADTRSPEGQHSGNTGGPITDEEEFANIDWERSGLPDPGDELASPSGIDEARAVLDQPRAKKLFATAGGQRFEVPEQPSSLGLGEEWDAMYNSLVDGGEDPAAARKFVLAEHKSDRTQRAIGDRAATQIQSRETLARELRPDVETQEDWLNRRLAQSEKNARIGAASRVAAATPTLKIDTANRADMGTLRQGFKEWKNTVNLAIDSKSHKRLSTAMHNLDSGNAMQEREAAESLVAIFKGGGQVTKASQDLLLKHLAGVVGDVETFFQHMATGNFGSRELNVLKQATRSALAEEQEKFHAYQESAAATFGPGSGYEQLGGNVNAMVKGAFKQFGYDVPDIYPDAQPVILGSGQRPATPKAKPTVPAGATMGTMNGKRGYVLNGKFTPVE